MRMQPPGSSHRRAALEGRRIDLPCLELRDTSGRPVQAIARILARHEAPGRTGLQAYFADITEQKLMQRELADALAENRRLSQQHLQVQEEERRHIARELHDEMGQCLNAIKLDAVAIRDHGEQGAQGRARERASDRRCLQPLVRRGARTDGTAAAGGDGRAGPGRRAAPSGGAVAAPQPERDQPAGAGGRR